MEQADQTVKFIDINRTINFDVAYEQVVDTPIKVPKRKKTTALDTFMVVDKIKVTKFDEQNLRDSVWMWP
jgi:hypothetical protein